MRGNIHGPVLHWMLYTLFLLALLIPAYTNLRDQEHRIQSFAAQVCHGVNSDRHVLTRSHEDIRRFMLAAADSRAQAAKVELTKAARRLDLRAVRIYRRLAADFRPLALRTCKS